MEPTSVGGFNEAVNEIVATALVNQRPLVSVLLTAWYFFTHGGWVILVYVFWRGLKFWWHHTIEEHYDHARQWVLLAIDVPRDNIQSPKAVENIFAHLAGAHANNDLIDTWWKGKTQDYFSFEIVGIDGYVQFLIRTPVTFRDLVESAIYSQYPDAQISEVEDYTSGFPTQFPNDKYDLYGTEFILVEDQLFPIKTYTEFEHLMTRELKDPLTTLLESLNKLGPGEQVWLQLIIVPTDESWKKPANGLIKKIMNVDTGKVPGVSNRLAGEVSSFWDEAQRQILGLGESSAPSKSTTSLTLLAPDDQARVDGISRKIKKIGYLTKFRLVYVAPKEKFVAAHGREAIIGAVKQFNTGDVNSLKPDTSITGVHAHYFFTKYRKDIKRTKLMRRYKNRSHYAGRARYILNTEELATIWHFPVRTEFTPIRHMVQRTEYKHTPPPTSLPVVSSRRPSGDRQS
jgi:hypothetical protein